MLTRCPHARIGTATTVLHYVRLSRSLCIKSRDLGRHVCCVSHRGEQELYREISRSLYNTVTRSKSRGFLLERTLHHETHRGWRRTAHNPLHSLHVMHMSDPARPQTHSAQQQHTGLSSTEHLIPFIPCMSCICQIQTDPRHTALRSNTQASAELCAESKALGYTFSRSYIRAYLI